MPLIIAGRDFKKGKEFSETLGHAEAVAMDVTKVNQISPLNGKLAAVVSATERVLTIGGNTETYYGVTFPEHHEDIDIALATLQEHGVRISIES
jgi:hypothetical protein